MWHKSSAGLLEAGLCHALIGAGRNSPKVLNYAFRRSIGWHLLLSVVHYRSPDILKVSGLENNPTLDRQHLAGMPGRQDDGDPIYIFILGGV